MCCMIEILEHRLAKTLFLLFGFYEWTGPFHTIKNKLGRGEQKSYKGTYYVHQEGKSITFFKAF